MTGFLRNAARVQPLVLVLEDLHWADRGALDLLTHLARNLEGARLLIIGTYRDVEVDRAHPLAASLGELRRGTTLQRVLLRGLTPDEVHRMLSAIAGHELAWGLAEAVHRQTEGNPLFIQEVLRFLVEEGLLTREQGRWQRTGDLPLAMSIPEGLRDVIGRRLSRLSPECNQGLCVLAVGQDFPRLPRTHKPCECNRLLSFAAVIGRDFALETLRALAGTSGVGTSRDLSLQQIAEAEEAILAALEEAERAGVLETQTRQGGVAFRFAHAFFRAGGNAERS